MGLLVRHADRLDLQTLEWAHEFLDHNVVDATPKPPDENRGRTPDFRITSLLPGGQMYARNILSGAEAPAALFTQNGRCRHGHRREAPGIITHADHHFVQPTSVRRVLVGMVGVLLVVAGCGDDDDGVEAAAPADTGGRTLEGESWLLSADAPLGLALEAVRVTAHFEDGALTGRSGCNEYSTTYDVRGDSLTIGPNVASTQMACPPPQATVERAYLDRLPRAARYKTDGDTLTMTDDQGRHRPVVPGDGWGSGHPGSVDGDPSITPATR